MHADPSEPAVYYEHVEGLTRGMHVKWEFHPVGGGTHVRITHEWAGPRWPLIGAFAARHVIGPWFISAVAARTLRGVARAASRNTESSNDSADASVGAGGRA